LKISLSLPRERYREGSKVLQNPEPIPTLPFEPKAHQPLAEKMEGLIGRINFDIIILSFDCHLIT